MRYDIHRLLIYLIPMKIVFAGSPEFALPSFERLLASNHTLCAAYTQPDRPSGRGRKTTPTVIKTAADANNITVYCPTSLKDEQQAQQLQNMQPDIMVVVAYGLLLPQRILDIPRLGCTTVAWCSTDTTQFIGW